MKPNNPAIELKGVRQNNLKNLSVQIPLHQMTVITGLSGSGKTTLAFDTLYAEGQRRYVESLSTYTRQFLNKMPKPLMDSIENIPPAIALEQRNSVLNSRSTVATQTELLDYLRLFFSKVGVLNCEGCGTEIREITSQRIQELSLEWSRKKRVAILAPLALLSTENLKTQTFVPSYFTILLEQGFRKVYWSKKKEWLELDQPPPASLSLAALTRGELYLLMDRFSISEPDSDTLSRFRDSLDQALRYGHEKVTLLDWDQHELKAFQTGFCCVGCGKQYRQPTPNSFSYNSPMGACETCNGFGHNLELSESKVVPRQKLALNEGAIDPFSKPSMKRHEKALLAFCTKHRIRISKKYSELSAAEKKLIWEQIHSSFEKIAEDKYKFHIRLFIRRYQDPVLCKSCNGSRFKSDTLKIKFRDHSIGDVLEKPIGEVFQWLKEITLTKPEKELLKELFPQILKRLEFLCRVGVSYLNLNRLTRTLSGGEFQRINLATHLGNGLCGTLYVLDEPTIGLHPHDTQQLLDILRELREQGNTVVVVEHEKQILNDADWIIEMGPHAGHQGGQVMASGKPQHILGIPCRTQKLIHPDYFLKRNHPLRKEATPLIKLKGCSENNLKNINVSIPLGKVTVVTGVSGSGKTSLVHHTLANFLRAQLQSSSLTEEDEESEETLGFTIGKHEKITGFERIRNLYLLDQKPIGKNSRSNPATYLKAWDEIRKIFSNQTLSLSRGYTPGFFSFNVDGGRCPTCKGEGEVTVDMHFMSAIKLQCEDCEGKRFSKPILDVKFKNRSISDLLELTIDEAHDLFFDFPALRSKFGILKEVGLGYLHVGQSGPTLSGGESQRLKIAAVLEQENAQPKGSSLLHQDLFILDEPTTGLHQEDIDRLLNVLHKLADRGKTVVMIEHHLGVIANSDWVIDLGPEGGKKGGTVIAQCTPEEILKIPESKTGSALKSEGFKPEHF